jgi:PPP family 3-phenylpropionic acid transporter
VTPTIGSRYVPVCAGPDYVAPGKAQGRARGYHLDVRWLRALYVSNGLAVGALYGFVPVLLQAKGFGPALIGLTLSLGSVAYTLALPAWGHVGDIISGPRRALQIACIPAAVFAFGFSLPLPIVAVMVCQVVLGAGGGPAMALTDAMAMPALADPSREYSRLRLLSSAGAAVGAIGCGIVYSQTGYVTAPLMYFIAIALTLISAQFVPLGRDSERHRNARRALDGRDRLVHDRGRFGSVGEAFRIRPRLVAVLISVILIFMGVMAAGTYITLRLADLGGGAAEVGFSNGIGWAAEVPGLILAGWLISRFGMRSVLLESAVGFAACMLSWIVLVDALPIMVTRFASGIFFGGIIASLVLTMARILPERLQATGQTLLQASGFGVAAILSNLLGGVLYATAGPLGVFGGGAACAVVGGLIGLVALPRDEVASDRTAAESVAGAA